MLLYGYLINSNQENDVFVASKRDRFDWICVTLIMWNPYRVLLFYITNTLFLMCKKNLSVSLDLYVSNQREHIHSASGFHPRALCARFWSAALPSQTLTQFTAAAVSTKRGTLTARDRKRVWTCCSFSFRCTVFTLSTFRRSE